MAGAFTAVDLSKLPIPDAVEQIDYETILAEMLDELRARDTIFNALVESDPAYKILEVAAYRETLIRKRNNEAVIAVMLAYAKDKDLDNLAADYNVERKIIVPGNPNAIPPVDPVYESDEELRRRVQLSFEGFSTAGPEGAYIFHSLGADPDVLDASVYGPPDDKGVVKVAVLSRTGTGTASSELVQKVNAVLTSKDVRPLTDDVQVASAQIINYQVTGSLKFYPGPDKAVVMQASLNALNEYKEKNRKLGRDITRAGIITALCQEGVMDVTLTSPAANVTAAWNQAAYCTAVNITDGGTDE